MIRSIPQSTYSVAGRYKVVCLSLIFMACQSEANNDPINEQVAIEVPIKDSSDNTNTNNANQNQLSSILPEPNCLIWDRDLDCLLSKPETITESCTQYRSALEMTPSLQEIGHVESCQSSPPKTADLQSAESLLNYIRSRSGQPEATLVSSDEYADCALRSHVEHIEESWNSGSSCYTEELNAFTNFNASKVFGPWSITALIDKILSANRLESLGFRHWLLSSSLSSVDIGLNSGASCINFNFVSNVSTPLNFSFYPGVGQIPLEMLNPGNHLGQSVPWSIQIDEPNAQIKTLSIYLITNESETRVDINNLNYPQTEANVMKWQLNSAPQAGQVYKVNVTWETTNSEEERNIDLYLAFNDCGYQMPLNCNPNRTDQCVIPGHECIYYLFANTEENWFCLPEGPRDVGEGCSDYPPACQGQMVCSNLETGNMCRSFCSLETSSSISCDEVCTDYSVAEVASYRIGVCN